MQQPDLILHLRQLTVCLWIVLIAVWLIGALRTKRTAWRQPHSARLEQMLLLVPGVYLLFARTQVPPALNQAIFPATLLPVSFGFLLALCGVGFSIWARMTLGTNWSSTVTLKDDHTLVRSGPYLPSLVWMMMDVTAAVLPAVLEHRSGQDRDRTSPPGH